MNNKGMSPGCIVGMVIVGFFVVSAVLLFVVFGAGLVFYKSQGVPTVNDAPVTGSAPVASAPSSSGAVSRPDPTPEQARAVEGGQSIMWADQGMSWTVPSGWNKQQETKEIFSVKSPGSWDAGWLTVSISPMAGDFPTDVSIEAMYKSALDQKQLGKYTMVRWLELDGIRGVQFAEAAPEDSAGVQRVQWQGYRKYNNQTQLINLMVHSSGKGFPTHQDTLYGILYTSKVSK